MNIFGPPASLAGFPRRDPSRRHFNRLRSDPNRPKGGDSDRPFWEARFYVGVDLGQVRDFTAVAVVERVQPETDPWEAPPVYHVRHLDRAPLETEYPAIVETVADLTKSRELRGSHRLLVDQTGVGAPVFDMFKREGLDPIGITIQGGDTVSGGRKLLKVPKRDLVVSLQVAFQDDRLKIAEGLPHAATLVEELQGFQVKITTAGHDQYGTWREGEHDDLVLALALAIWYPQHYWEQWARRKRSH